MPRTTTATSSGAFDNQEKEPRQSVDHAWQRPQHSVELTQDCVAWDESDNVDLRLLARSPLMPSTPALLATPRTTRSSSSSSSSGSSTARPPPRHSATRALESLKRQLHTSSATAIAANNALNRRQQTTLNSESEIDGILQVLQRQDDKKSSVSSSSPTVVTRHHATSNHLKRAASYPPSNLTTTTVNVLPDVPRRGQKRRQPPPDNANDHLPPVPKKKITISGRSDRHRMQLLQANHRPSSTQSLPTNLSSIANQEPGVDNNHLPFDFDSLLQQLDDAPRTKDSSKPKETTASKRPPFQTIPNMPPPASHRRQSSLDNIRQLEEQQPKKPLPFAKENLPPTTTCSPTRSQYQPSTQPQSCNSSNELSFDNQIMAPPRNTDTRRNVAHFPHSTTSSFERFDKAQYDGLDQRPSSSHDNHLMAPPTTVARTIRTVQHPANSHGEQVRQLHGCIPSYHRPHEHQIIAPPKTMIASNYLSQHRTLVPLQRPQNNTGLGQRPLAGTSRDILQNEVIPHPPPPENRMAPPNALNTFAKQQQSQARTGTSQLSSTMNNASAASTRLAHVQHTTLCRDGPCAEAIQSLNFEHPLAPNSGVTAIINVPDQHSSSCALEPQDEFGDMKFSADDWDNLDSLILAATTQPTTTQEDAPSSIQHLPYNSGKAVPIHNQSFIPSPPRQCVPTKPLFKQEPLEIGVDQPYQRHEPCVEPRNIALVEDDPFDDFPMIDFDALDQKIAESRNVVDQSTTAAPPSTYSHPVGNPGGYLLPPINAVVRNPRVAESSENVSNLAFLAFSRYTVLKVESDTVSYTKTLLVSAWESNTPFEEKSGKWLHRSELLEQSVGAIQTRHGWVSRQILESPVHGCIHLRGEWYHTSVDRGDTIHLCSLEGKYRTDAAALPVILHTCPPQGSDPYDDLVLVIHPDELLFPSIISEAVTCSRRAVLRARLGSSGINAKAPLFGTLRHEFFERCIQSQDFSIHFAKDTIHKIITKNAEALVGCGVTRSEAEEEILRVLPQFQIFANEYTSFAGSNHSRNTSPTATVQGMGINPPMRFVADRVLGAEETVVSPELGVKGSIDVLVQATTQLLSSGNLQQQNPTKSRMSIELKTGFKQSDNNTHAAQLAFYAVMLRARYGSQRIKPSEFASASDIGAADGGMLLYINHESLRTQHITPMINEIKSLIGQRNLVASELLTASSPRGLVLEYANGDLNSKVISPKLLPAPPAPLPEMLPMSQLCKMCYARRECTMYAAAESGYYGAESDSNLIKGHSPLLQQYTGHLDNADIAYFLEWDRLVDLEIDACSTSSAAAWLVSSAQRERSTGQCLSSLVLDESSLVVDETSDNMLVFKRSLDAIGQSSFPNLDIEPGCYVIVSTDASITDISKAQSVDQSKNNRVRHHLYLVRGTIAMSDSLSVTVHASHNDAERARAFVRQSQEVGNVVRFRLDKDLASFGTGTLRQNLINFFTRDGDMPETTNTKEAVRYDQRLPRLRDMVVRLKPPQFEDGIKKSIFNSRQAQAKAIPGCDMLDLALEFAELNPDQQAAVEKAIAARDYSLIQGLPGTGKTSTIAFVARLLAAHGQRVLITSYTHAAVDNVLLKLLENGMTSSNEPTLVRVGNKSSCHGAVHSILATTIASRIASGFQTEVPTMSVSDEEPVSPEDLTNVMGAARIVGVTALTIPRSALLANQHFDVVIVDEAGQISQPAVLGALMAADNFILVGDHLQLPPLVQSELAEKGGYGVSLLKRLADAHPSAVAQLTLQYRMHEDICQLSNELVYGGKLKCANDQVRTQLLALKHFPHALPHPMSPTLTPWLIHAIHPQRPVVFVDTDQIRVSVSNGSTAIEELEGSVTRQRGGNVVNETEATLIHHVVQGLISAGLDAASIGIVTPFRAQVRVLEDKGRVRQWKSGGLEVSTIDRYQGRDKRAIIISFVRSNVKGRVGRLLSDPRRLNVAMTRAKCKLIMVGSFSTLHKGSDMLRPVLDGIRTRSQILELPENALSCYNII